MLAAHENTLEIVVIELVELGEELSAEPMPTVSNNANTRCDGFKDRLVELRHEGALFFRLSSLINVEQIDQRFDGGALPDKKNFVIKVN
jgi:hypothetical protein